MDMVMVICGGLLLNIAGWYMQTYIFLFAIKLISKYTESKLSREKPN